MARLNDLGKGKLEAPKLRPEIIKIKAGHNYRDMTTPEVRKHIDWLKSSIRLIGVQEPIDVSFDNGKVYLEAGECRLTAAQELRKEGWDGWIPAFAITGDEAKILAKGLLDNSGLPPTKMEFGKAAQRLLDYGWAKEDIAPYTPPHIAQNLPKALRYVTEAVDLHNAPLDVKKAVKEGVEGVKISEPAALAAVRGNRLQSGEILKEQAREAKAKGKTEVKRPKGEGKATKEKKAKEQDVEKCLRLADALATVVLDDNLTIEESFRCARAYNRARGR